MLHIPPQFRTKQPWYWSKVSIHKRYNLFWYYIIFSIALNNKNEWILHNYENMIHHFFLGPHLGTIQCKNIFKNVMIYLFSVFIHKLNQILDDFTWNSCLKHWKKKILKLKKEKIPHLSSNEGQITRKITINLFFTVKWYV